MSRSRGYAAGINQYLADIGGAGGHHRSSVPGGALGSTAHRDATSTAASSSWPRWRRPASPSPASPRRSRPSVGSSRRSPGVTDDLAGSLPVALASQPAEAAALAGQLEAVQQLPSQLSEALGIGSNAYRPRWRSHRQRHGHGAGQPALPVARRRAALPDAPHDPRAGQRVGRRPVRRAARAHRPHRRRRLVAHRVDRLPVHALRAHARARRPDVVPRRRPARGDDPAGPHRRGAAARRLARHGDALAVDDPLRADAHQPARPAAVPLDAVEGLRARRRQRAGALPQPVLPLEPGALHRGALRHRAGVPRHPVGQHDRRRPRRQCPLLRRVGRAERPRQQGRRRAAACSAW